MAEGSSLYDRLGGGWSLLRLRDDVDAGPLVEAAAARGVPLDVLELRGQEFEKLYGASLVLVRPDQHVVWRGASADLPTAGAIVDRVRGV